MEFNYFMDGENPVVCFCRLVVCFTYAKKVFNFAEKLTAKTTNLKFISLKNFVYNFVNV